MSPNVSNLVKSIQDIMRKDAGTYGDAQRLEQLGWMFFLKIFDDREKELELLRDNYKSPLPQHLRWSAWASDEEGITGEALLDFVNNTLLPKLKALTSGGDRKEQANLSYAAGAGKGQGNGRGHCLLSAAKLTAIIHCMNWERYLSQKKDCRVSIRNPFSHFFNTLSDRLADLTLPSLHTYGALTLFLELPPERSHADQSEPTKSMVAGSRVGTGADFTNN